MSYAMVILRDDEEWESLSDAEREFDALVRWWSDLRERGVIVAGAQLAPPRAAMTVSWQDRQPIVTDGPHIEAKESIGGIGILAVDSMDAALEIVKSWPSTRGIRIEVRLVTSR